jgi:hypothetical protein
MVIGWEPQAFRGEGILEGEKLACGLEVSPENDGVGPDQIFALETWRGGTGHGRGVSHSWQGKGGSMSSDYHAKTDDSDAVRSRAIFGVYACLPVSAWLLSFARYCGLPSVHRNYCVHV